MAGFRAAAEWMAASMTARHRRFDFGDSDLTDSGGRRADGRLAAFLFRWFRCGAVAAAKAGVYLAQLDSGFRRNDEKIAPPNSGSVAAAKAGVYLAQLDSGESRNDGWGSRNDGEYDHTA